MHFREEALIQIGNELAKALELSPPPDDLFQSKIQEILIERENYDGALKGIITKEETASLILQHFQTLICHSAGTNEATLTKGWSSLVPKTIQALFVI